MSRQLGLLLPVKLGPSGYFSTTDVPTEQIKSNLINLILTKKGERMFQPTLGCDIHNYVFESQTSDNIANIQASIQAAVKRWMPYVSISSIEVTYDTITGKTFVSVAFSVLSNVNATDSIILEF